jgi:hypothetical protein
VSDELPRIDAADWRALEARLLGVVRQLGPDERRVVLEVAERLVAGRKAYGPLGIANDGRDFNREAGDELLDAVAYLAMETLRGRRDGGAR